MSNILSFNHSNTPPASHFKCQIRVKWTKIRANPNEGIFLTSTGKGGSRWLSVSDPSGIHPIVWHDKNDDDFGAVVCLIWCMRTTEVESEIFSTDHQQPKRVSCCRCWLVFCLLFYLLNEKLNPQVLTERGITKFADHFPREMRRIFYRVKLSSMRSGSSILQTYKPFSFVCATFWPNLFVLTNNAITA